MIAYAAQRTGELATRLALGASGRQVFWLMMGAGKRVALAGVVVGLGVAYVGGRLVASSVYAMLTAGAIVAIVTFAATMVPSIKASRLDPAQALRPE